MARRRYSRSTPVYEALYEELRKRACTQSEAAELVGVSKQVMSNWIAGRHIPSGAHLASVATFLGVSAADVEAMSQRAQRVDRIAELERVQAQLVRELAALRLAFERAGVPSEDCEPRQADGQRAHSSRATSHDS